MEKTDTTRQTISKEKLSKYMSHKINRLSEEGYYDSQYRPQWEEFIFSNKDEYDLQETSKKIMNLLPRDQLKWEHEDIPNYLVSWAKSTLQKRIDERNMTEKEYTNIMQQVEKYWSVIAESNKRNREYGGGWGDIILSVNTGKMYDVDWAGNAELLKDYKGKQYYSSRTWASGAGYIFAGKTSLIYLPTTRMDVAHPELWGRQKINWMDIAVLTHRWLVDEQHPTVIKDCAWVDMVLLSQKDHLSPDGSGKFLWEVIKTKWAHIEELPLMTFRTTYYDENLEQQEVSFTYRTNMDPKEINFNAIGKVFLGINRWFDVEDTGRFTDQKVGIKKYKDKYVRLWTFWLIKEVFDEHPIQKTEDKLYIDEIAIWSANRIEHEKIEVEVSGYPNMINGWEIKNDLACKENKKEWMIFWYEIERICKEHNVDTNELYEEFDNHMDRRVQGYHSMIYEKRVSDINSKFDILDKEYMEYEETLPSELFEKFPRSYREAYMERKLHEKVINERTNTLSRSSKKIQKEIALEFLKTNPKEKFDLTDSYAVGNCKEWTQRFVNAFWLKESWVKAEDLMKHKHISKMMEESRFRAVILKKILESNDIQQ